MRARTFTLLLCIVATAAVSSPDGAVAGLVDAAAMRGPSGESAIVARGRYLATAGNCISCHTMPGGAVFAGGVAFNTDFGTIHSTNITPDPRTGIGKWTQEDFRRAMREGIAPGGRRLFPACPYTAYTKLTDPDIAAIYEYLRSLTPVPQANHPPNSMLFRWRSAMAFWNARYLEVGPMRADPAKSLEWNRGAYLIEALAHCSACHTPRDSFMGEEPARRYAGGVVYHAVAPGKVRRWSAVNITQHRSGLAQWSVEDIERYLARGVNRWAGSFGPMNEVLVNSTMKLTPEDVRAMAVYLKSLPARSMPTEVEPAVADARGKALYKEHCEECHMSSGRGGMFGGPPLAGSVIVRSPDPTSLLNIVLYGPDTSPDASYGTWETMKAYEKVLNDAEIAAIANYARASWNNAAGSVTAADVAAQR